MSASNGKDIRPALDTFSLVICNSESFIFKACMG
jgi:hypothetical protein